jgi:hypothetical protein
MTLADGLKCPSNFVMNETHVYWGSDTTIYRVAR